VCFQHRGHKFLLYPGLWSQHTKPRTPTPQFLKLQLLHKSLIRIKNGKPIKMVNCIIRHFITTMWIVRLLFFTYNLYLNITNHSCFQITWFSNFYLLCVHRKWLRLIPTCKPHITSNNDCNTSRLCCFLTEKLNLCPVSLSFHHQYSLIHLVMVSLQTFDSSGRAVLLRENKEFKRR
jgi:hypothetical protein